MKVKHIAAAILAATFAASCGGPQTTPNKEIGLKDAV